MKTLKHANAINALVGLLAAGILPGLVMPAQADNMTWTNAVGDLLWATPANWTNSTGANVVPAAADRAFFGLGVGGSPVTNLTTVGATNLLGAVNNIVAADITVSNLYFATIAPAYHTTQINTNVTLTVSDPSTTGNQDTFHAPGGMGVVGTADQSYTVIQGAGSLVVGDPSNPNPNPNTWLRVDQAGTSGTYQGTLNMANLNRFTFAGGGFMVGGAGSRVVGVHGKVLLAKTNLIIVTDTTQLGTLRIGNNTGNGAGTETSSTGDLQLGQQNEIRVYDLRVGGGRSSSGTMEFQSGSSNPTLKLRGPDGVGRVTSLSVGDNWNASTTLTVGMTANGTLDLTGGTVDALVTSLFVARTLNSTTATRAGSAVGTLTWTAGTVDTVDLELGCQVRNNTATATGVANVRTNAVLNVQNLYIGGDAGSGTGSGTGTLNITDGGRVNVTNFVSNTFPGPGGHSTINITNGTLTASGLVRVENLTAKNAVLGLAVGPTITNGNPVCNVANLTLVTAVTINVSGPALELTRYPLIQYAGSIGGDGAGVATLGALPPQTYGYLTNDTTVSSIVLVITNVAAVKWNGNVNGDWDINTTTNWLDTGSGAPTTYKQSSIPGSWVLFDDTASGARTVNLTTTLSPQSMVVNTTNAAPAYTFTGTGRISGPAGLSKTGNGTLELANSGANDYSGGTIVGEGTLLVNSALAGSGAVIVQSGATLGGTGTLSGPVTIGSAAMLAPGNSIGTLNFNNTLVLSAGSSNIFEVDSDSLAHDQVAGLGGVTYGGTLLVSLSGGGTAITNGAEIQFFSPAGSGRFATIVPAFPAPGLLWDTNTLASDGKLRVVTIPLGNQVIWTNVAGGDLLWSNPSNWIRTNTAYAGSPTPNSVPTANDKVFFLSTNNGEPAATNVQGAVDNIVAADVTVSNLYHEALAPAFHTTLINPGVTLTVNDPILTNNQDVFHAPGALGAVGPSDLAYTTIQGGGSLVIGNPATPNTNPDNWFRVDQACASSGTYQGTLDMANLNSFTFAGGGFMVGGGGNRTIGVHGQVLLAKTNLIIVADTTQLGTLRIGNCTGNGAGSENSSAGDLQLGQQNEIRVYNLKVGGGRSTSGTVEFQTGLTSPTLKLRGVDGTDRVPTLSVGDNYDASSTTSVTIPANGTLDLTGGTADALVANLYVGRILNSTTATRDGSANGTLTWTAGTFDVLQFELGCQVRNNLGNAFGVANVRSNATLLVQDLWIGGDAGSAGGSGTGMLNIDGGQVTVTNAITQFSGPGGSSTITITSDGVLNIGSSVTVDALQLDGGRLHYLPGNTADITGAGHAITINGAGATIDTDTNTVTFAGDLGNFGGGGLTKTGSGTLRLSGSSSYIGGTTVSNGTLLVDSSLGGAPVTVSSGATLGGNGTIAGPVTVLTGGNFSPGASIGTLIIYNDLVLSAGSLSTFEVDLDTLTCDSVTGLNSVSYGGTLHLLNVGGTGAATNGATLQLFSAANYSSTSFATTNLPALGGGLAWDTSGLTNNGTVTIVAVPTGPNITYKVTGSTLALTWPGSQLGYYAQSNSASVANPGAWHDIANSQLGTNLDITINPARSNVFYRLRSP